ncbi:MAG: hypothetical protein RL557_253 [archaeon]|jgi:hypothetical protein
MIDDLLYKDVQLMITYLHSPESGRETEVVSVEDHELWMKSDKAWTGRYILQRGVLRELADDAQEGRYSVIELKLNSVDHALLREMHECNISVLALAKALKGAYQNQEDAFEVEYQKMQAVMDQ